MRKRNGSCLSHVAHGEWVRNEATDEHEWCPIQADGYAYCGACCPTPKGDGLRAHSSFLGSKRVPYATWIKTATMYVWPLWRNWTAPRPVKVETGAQVRARHLATKPADYSWRIEKLTPAERRAFAVAA